MKNRLAQLSFSTQAEIDYWKSIYDREDFLGNCYKQRMNQAISWLDTAGLSRNSIIVDVGCGAGILLQQIARRGYRTIGTDYSRAMIREARSICDMELRPRVQFVQGDVERLPFADSSLDFIICLGVVTYLRSEVKALSELSRVLIPNGTLILSVVNKAHLPHYLDLPRFAKLRVQKALGMKTIYTRRKANSNTQSTVRSYFIPEIIKSLQHQGFEVEDYRTVPLGLLTFLGFAIPPVKINAKITALLAQPKSIPVIRSFGGMCIFRALKS